MPDEQPTPSRPTFTGPVTPLAVRLPEELRTHLDLLAQLNGRSTTEECRVALETWAIEKLNDPEVAKRAQAAAEKIEREAASKLAELERETKAKRNAMAAILSATRTAPKAGSKPVNKSGS